jgi:hypothetical protein
MDIGIVVLIPSPSSWEETYDGIWLTISKPSRKLETEERGLTPVQDPEP